MAKLDHIEVGVRSERDHTPYVSTISVAWKYSDGNSHSVYLSRREAIETAARILAMVSLLPPMDTTEIEKVLERVDHG